MQGTFLDREEAVRSALSLGMPLNEIEAYLDWADSIRPDSSLSSPKGGDADRPPSSSGVRDPKVDNCAARSP